MLTSPISPDVIIEYGLDLILSHFEQNMFWPRTISTKTTEGGQQPAYSKQEALGHFKRANFINCKVNAYPIYIEWNGLNKTAPNFIFIDLDLGKFQVKIGTG